MRIPSRDEIQTPSGMYRAIEELHRNLNRVQESMSEVQSSREEGVRSSQQINGEFVESLRIALGLDTNPTGAPRNTYDADRDSDPAVDNLNEGYMPGCEWRNIKATPLPSVWKCVQSSSETAAWRRIDRP